MATYREKTETEKMISVRDMAACLVTQGNLNIHNYIFYGSFYQLGYSMRNKKCKLFDFLKQITF